MSYLLEALGRGLLSQLLDAFENQLPACDEDELEELQARRAASPRSVDLAMRLGVLQLRNLRLREAQATFESALELSDSALQPTLGLACVADELGQLDQALRHLATAQAHDPNDPAIAFAIAFCHEREGDEVAAEANYHNATRLCPELRNAHERLAALAIRQGDWQAATERYELLAKLEPDDLDIRLALGALYLQQQRSDDAIQQFQRALLLEPECADPGVEATEELTREGRLAEAIASVQKLIRKYPGVADFHVHLGDLYAKSGDDGNAIRQYRKALENQPNYLEATVKLGTQHLRSGRFVDAAQAFNRAVELNDRLTTAFVGLGVAQHAGRHTDEAYATFDLAANLEPNSTLLFCEASRLQLKSDVRQRRRLELLGPTEDEAEPPADDLLEEALRRHQQALLQHPNHADLHYRHGLLLRQVGRCEEATEAFRNAVQINPQYAKALIKLGICLKEAGETDEAVEVFRRALELGHDYVDVHYQLGLLFAQRSRFDLAVEEFEHAVAGQQRNISFRANLALALQNVGMVDRASATWRSICELSRDEPSMGRSRGVRSSTEDE